MGPRFSKDLVNVTWSIYCKSPPMGTPRAIRVTRTPSFNATRNFQHITKSAEAVTTPEMIWPVLRRAFTLARNGRPGPCLVEVYDVFRQEVPSIKTVTLT